MIVWIYDTPKEEDVIKFLNKIAEGKDTTSDDVEVIK